MLKIVKNTRELNITHFLRVYEESIRENSERFSTSVQKAEDAFLAYLEDDFFRQRDAFYAFWIVDGIYKSALRMEPYRDGLLLQALETAPDDRGHGYAEALMKEVLAYLEHTEFKVIYSHVDKQNRASYNVHMKCGFFVHSDVATYIDGTVTNKSYTLCRIL